VITGTAQVPAGAVLQLRVTMTDLYRRSDRAAPVDHYIIPSFIERTSYGIKSQPYKQALRGPDHLPVYIDDASANDPSCSR
jgi:hypothetical protein